MYIGHSTPRWYRAVQRRTTTQHMTTPARFDRRYGKGALARLRSMLDDPTVTYERIAKNLGLTKQRIGQFAKDFGVNGRQREHERISGRAPRITREDYPHDVRAVIRNIRRCGIRVQPFNSMQRTQPRIGRQSQRMVLANGSLCSIQVRKGRKLRPTGREYVRFDVSGETRRAKFALWAVKNGGSMSLYVIPLSHLRNVATVYVPVEGKYAVGSSKKPRKDWTLYEGAWHFLATGQA
jgi:hypothetical protein